MATVTLKRRHEEIQTKPGQLDQTANKKRNVSPESRAKIPEPELQTESQPQREKVRKTLVIVAHPEDVAIQIVAGSYDRVLHGMTASIPARLLDLEASTEPNGNASGIDEFKDEIDFSDNFLFAAHTSSIRCLALSPPTDSNKRLLATGSSDERINLYSLSTTPSTSKAVPSKPTLLSTSTKTTENPSNRPLGSLTHHSRPLTAVHFPSKSKLFTTSEDNTIAITRTKDWTLLSTIKAPIPKPLGRPSGDTLVPGEVPAGVNDFAIHPSHKLMISVGRGERCMRLWNLMTGKKAGVLQFEREVLAQVGEGKWGTGEGRKVLWSESGECFLVGFERGAVVFGVDSKPKAVLRPVPERTKVHQMRFLPQVGGLVGRDVLAVSTEDGRVLFYDTKGLEEEADPQSLPQLPCLAQLGGNAAGTTNRIKDFEILQLPETAPNPSSQLLVVTANSDGAIRLWTLRTTELAEPEQFASASSHDLATAKSSTAQVGHLIGTVETGNRITCLGAFIMDGKKVSNGALEQDEVEDLAGADDQISQEDEDDDGDEEEFEGLD